MKATAFVEANRRRIDVRVDTRTPMSPRKVLGGRQQLAAIPAPLDILTDGDATKHCEVAVDVHANHTDRFGANPEHERVITGSRFIRSIWIVFRSFSAAFEEHFTTDRVIHVPLRFSRRASQFVTHLSPPNSRHYSLGSRRSRPPWTWRISVLPCMLNLAVAIRRR